MIIHSADCLPQPWKNGLGQTREIAVQPSADGSGFLWRVSIAEVNTAAPFSAFPGVDRVIALLAGAGFSMTLDDGRVHALTTPFAPFAFSGQVAVNVQLANGPTRDFNLMVRRSLAHGELQVWRTPSPRAVDSATVLVYCAQGSIDTSDGVLGVGDAWRPAAAHASEITLHADTVALVVRVEPRAI